jgi:hypothetical protein
MNCYLEANFKAWLELSGIRESEFLVHGKSKSLKIDKTETRGEIRITLTIGGVKVGMPIITNPDGYNEHFKQNAAFLLMLMAEKLDTVHGGEYFCSVVQDFVRCELKVR